MKLKIKKFMNFRLGLCLAIALIVSILLASCLFVSQNLRLGLIIALSVIFVAILICIALFKKRFLIFLSAIVLMIVIPIAMIFAKSNVLNKNNSMLSEKTTYSGKIYSLSEELKDNAIFIELSDVRILSDDGEKNFKGHVYIRIYSDSVDTSKLAIGKRAIIFNSELNGLTLNEGTTKRDRSFLSRGVTATDFIFAYNLYVDENVSMNLRDKVKSSVFENFSKTDTFFTGIGYAMMFGESSVLNDDVYGVFKDAGIAHLLAVSGFHISVIVAFLSFILNKLKANKYLKMSIIGILLFVYAYFCSFSVSVIRASIMALLLLHATNRNKEYDKLSSLSLAAVVLLLINPLQLYSLSFIFSFISILSIIFIAPLFERLFSKILYDRLSSSLSISLAVCLGVAVFQLYYFGKMPILSILSNVITIPIVSVLFIFLLVSVVVGSIFNIIVPLINVFGFCMKYVVQFNGWIATNGLYIYASGFGAASLFLSILLMMVVSDYVFIKKKIKCLIAVPILALLVVSMI